MQNSTLSARDVSVFRNSQASAFPSGREHQNTHKIEGTVIRCPHFRGVRFSQVSARTGSTVPVSVARLAYMGGALNAQTYSVKTGSLKFKGRVRT